MSFAKKAASYYPVYIAIFVVLLILSIHGVTWIPFYSFRGLDLHNLFTFHNTCPEWPIPYEKSGSQCGDTLNRPMYYPPLVYWLMGWTRFVNFYQADLYWGFAIILLTGLGTWFGAVTEKRKTHWIWLLWGLLLLQMPMVYAVERGNNDALIIPVFMLGAFCFHRGRVFISGALLATACWMKVYPVIPSVVLLAAFSIDRDLRRAYFKNFFFGFLASGIFWASVLFPDSYRYVFEVLPPFAGAHGGFGVSSHTLYAGKTSVFVKLPYLAIWTYFVIRLFKRDPIFVFAALLAISTFFQNISNDYNLITTYPFLFLLMNRLLRRSMNAGDLGWLIFTVAALVGDRTIPEMLFNNRGALFMHLVWFLIFPYYVLKQVDKGRWPEGSLKAL